MTAFKAKLSSNRIATANMNANTRTKKPLRTPLTVIVTVSKKVGCPDSKCFMQ